jgi:hypothetical protein
LVAVDSKAFRKTYAGRIARRGVAVRAASGVASAMFRMGSIRPC